jgi:hypothetical protein
MAELKRINLISAAEPPRICPGNFVVPHFCEASLVHNRARQVTSSWLQYFKVSSEIPSHPLLQLPLATLVCSSMAQKAQLLQLIVH